MGAYQSSIQIICKAQKLSYENSVYGQLSRIFELTNGLFLIYCILRMTSSFMNADI